MLRITTCLAVLVTVAGCAGMGKTTGQKQVESLSRNLDRCMSALAQLDEELKATVEAHAMIVENEDGDYIGHFKSFDRGLKGIEKKRDLAKASHDAVTTTADQYFATWSASSEQFSSESMRKKSEKRLEKLQKEFEEIWKDSEDAREDYQELMMILRDHHLYWSSSLNASTAEELKKDSRKIARLADDLLERIAEARTAAQEFSEEIAQRVEMEKQAAEASQN